MLPGVRIYPLISYFDERGSFTELLRGDWRGILGDDTIAQINSSTSFPGIVRAWHRHLRGQIDYFLVFKGVLKICAFDEETDAIDEYVSTGEKLQIIRIPGHYWHGFKVIGEERAILIYFTTRLYDKKDPDEERRPWNDAAIIPKSINGRRDDLRVGEPWDWGTSGNR